MQACPPSRWLGVFAPCEGSAEAPVLQGGGATEAQARGRLGAASPAFSNLGVGIRTCQCEQGLPDATTKHGSERTVHNNDGVDSGLGGEVGPASAAPPLVQIVGR